MVSKTGMTILDYFKLAGIKENLAASRHSKASSSQTGSDTFRQILATTGKNFQSSPGKVDLAATASGGMSLSEYFKARVPARQIALPPSATKLTADNSQTAQKISSCTEAEPKKTAEILKSTPASKKTNTMSDRITAGITKAAAKYGLSPTLIRGVIQAESNFQVDAVSPAGAQGLMQLMPGTAKELGVTDPFDIEANVDGGSRYLKQMLDRFDGDVELALAAYNAGPGTVNKYGGIPPYRETQAYVDRILKYVGRMS